MTSNTAGRTSITVLGLGNLGQALAAAFLSEGHPTTVWNRSPHKAEQLVARGATLAATPADAVGASDIVVVTVLDYDTVREVLRPAAGALAGRTVVNLTTGTPGAARDLGAWTADQGAAYVDGAVYAVPQTIGTPAAFVLYSGDEAAYREHRPTLDLLGEGTFVGPAPALSSVYDTALLSGMYGMFAGFFQAVALAGTEGIEAAAVTSPLVRWLTAAADALPAFAEEIDRGEYTTATSNLEINAVGLRNILATTQEQGLSTDLLAPLQRLFDDQVDSGHASSSLSRTIESLRAGR
ncbi:NAD(P)-dependent oxidoreductase [Streptomyces sp. SP18CS02]|uniref:NAD(P)-dependent oxidoreductase n=1 Tax=Streptomyces sp. SP18CS02 TaxID=3002531 RepID=UPI002E7AA704|nr:NAD(P)-binding domain-containing protein [Streptomyces sp. SP18CS02]MEE1751915.1 NAD(P)-binding domain-containing protein [Streptomyces sp. SP18CS02]